MILLHELPVRTGLRPLTPYEKSQYISALDRYDVNQLRIRFSPNGRFQVERWSIHWRQWEHIYPDWLITIPRYDNELSQRYDALATPPRVVVGLKRDHNQAPAED